MSFRYYHVFLTIPRKLTERTQAIRIYGVTVDKVTVRLNDSEFIVSDIFVIKSKLSTVLRSPAMLEIRCNIMESRVGKFYELAMIQYDPISKSWIDVEQIAMLQKRFCE